jgi:hypothetical protein
MNPRLGALVGLCLFGLAAGITGVRAFDGSDVRAARAELGSEGLAPFFDLFAAWLGTLQHAKSPTDLAVPEQVEASLRGGLRERTAGRELRYLGWLDRFDASPAVSNEIRSDVKSRCWSQRATDPILCHTCAAGVLRERELAELRKREIFSWLIAFFGAALALIALWRLVSALTSKKIAGGARQSSRTVAGG